MLAVKSSECAQVVCPHTNFSLGTSAVRLELCPNALFFSFFLFFVEEQAKRLDPHSPLQPLNGQLLPLHSVLRPLRLLPLSAVQHHLQMLEN